MGIRRFAFGFGFLALSGCAMFSEKYVFEHAEPMANPVTAGKVDPVFNNTGRGTITPASYQGQVLCFNGEEQTHPSMITARKYQLTAYDTLEGEKLAGKSAKATRLDITAAMQRAITVQDKEQTTYKDSSGRVIGTAERPVERTEYVPHTQFVVCFPTKDVLTAKSKYLGLRVPTPTLFDSEAQQLVGAWRFADAH